MIKKAFTLAEVLIVIGIIGVVAALTLPNLNHATGDKETVTRLQKAYSILNEAVDRAVAIYGPVSTWANSPQCASNVHLCWMNRIGEFLKISKSCNEEVDSDSDEYSSCDSLDVDYGCNNIIYQLPDGITFNMCADSDYCKDGGYGWDGSVNDICSSEIVIDINGPKKGKNAGGQDVFRFMLSDSLGVMPLINDVDIENGVECCMANKDEEDCTWWPLEYGNLDFLKADENGKCNDSNIILDGTTNTSCH